jgi:hypothetical protein
LRSGRSEDKLENPIPFTFFDVIETGQGIN